MKAPSICGARERESVSQTSNVVGGRVPGPWPPDVRFFPRTGCSRGRQPPYSSARGSAGKFELALEWPTFKQPVDESRMKNISGASGVHGLHMKSRSVMEIVCRPRRGHLLAQGCGGEPAAKPALHGGQRLAQIIFSGKPAWNVPAGDQVIDIFSTALPTPG